MASLLKASTMTSFHKLRQASLVSAMLVSFAGCSKEVPTESAPTNVGSSAPQPWNGGAEPSEPASARLTPPDADSSIANEPPPSAESSSLTESKPPQPASEPNASESTFKIPPIVTAPQPTAAAPSPELDFTQLALAPNAGPKEIVDHLLEIDNSIKNLLMTQQARRISKDEALRQSAVLSGMKLRAAEELGRVADTPVFKDLAVLAKMEALSHSAGMGDEKAANELRSLAGNPGNFVSPVAAHQAAVVMLGLELSDLSGGIRDATAVLHQLDVVLDDPAKLKRPDFFASAQVVRILDQHNLVDASRSAKNKIATAFSTNADPQIGMMLWQMQLGDTPELNLLNQALEDRDIAPSEFQKRLDAVMAIAPNQWTLAQLMQQLTKIEYSGQIEKAGIMASAIEQNASFITIPNWERVLNRSFKVLKSGSAPWEKRFLWKDWIFNKPVSRFHREFSRKSCSCRFLGLLVPTVSSRVP